MNGGEEAALQPPWDTETIRDANEGILSGLSCSNEKMGVVFMRALLVSVGMVVHDIPPKKKYRLRMRRNSTGLRRDKGI